VGRPLERTTIKKVVRRRKADNYVSGVCCEDGKWTELTQDRVLLWVSVQSVC
jgi:hypothetical protein